MSVTPSTIIVGVFRDRATAEQAIEALYDAGFTRDQMRYSVLASSGGLLEKLKYLSTGSHPDDEIIVHDLTNIGLSNEEAHFYANEYNNGRTILTVTAPGHEHEAVSVLHQYGAYNPRPSSFISATPETELEAISQDSSAPTTTKEASGSIETTEPSINTSMKIHMSQVAGEELEIFYCYAREDDALRKELEIHLSGLKRTYHLKQWHDREINPGEEWEQTINEHLDTADLIFVLISPHFLASEYCYGKEMQRALERSKQGTCRIIPILLRPTLWEDIPFSKLQLLPTDTRAITSWPDRYEAFHDVATGISKVLKTLLAKRWNDKGNALRDLKLFDDALSAYEHAILLDPSFAYPWYNKGLVLCDLKLFDDALSAYEHAILLDPSDAYPWNGKGLVLCDLNLFDDALSAFEHAILLDPSESRIWYNKSLTLKALNRPKEAQEAREKARQLGYFLLI